MEYAGFWRRFTAYFLDNVILAFAELVFLFVLGLVLQLTGITDSINKDETSQIIAGTFLLILIIIVNWLYFSLMESSKFQATVGKIALNIKVVDYEGKKISFKLATIRYFSKLLSA
ncbi:RDD family protein, partial [Thermoanaerobacter sp. A7A]